RRNDASMTGQVMIYGGKFYFKWMFHKLHLQMSDYVQHLGCSSERLIRPTVPTPPVDLIRRASIASG
ncbi:hypothetical protein, partial [Escherichia coli]|uniref:hypothetical protein n=1 Tax=Escherichia coli TaxID=562 RepID=UPI00301A75F1